MGNTEDPAKVGDYRSAVATGILVVRLIPMVLAYVAQEWRRYILTMVLTKKDTRSELTVTEELRCEEWAT